MACLEKQIDATEANLLGSIEKCIQKHEELARQTASTKKVLNFKEICAAYEAQFGEYRNRLVLQSCNGYRSRLLSAQKVVTFLIESRNNYSATQDGIFEFKNPAKYRKCKKYIDDFCHEYETYRSERVSNYDYLKQKHDQFVKSYLESLGLDPQLDQVSEA